MKKKRLYIFFFFAFLLLGGAGVGLAQQIPAYTQFVLNNYMLNPAVAGTNLGIEAVTGSRVQWVGFDNAPVTNFASVTYGWRKNFSYKGKHGVGFYAEDDRRGMFSSKSAYLSYSYHIRIFTGLNLAAGLSVGLRQMALNQILYDAKDPAFSSLNYKSFFLIYPDVIPGVRMYTKKTFVDISIRQLYKNSIEQGSNHIGSNGSPLDPTLIFAIKRKIILGNNTWMLVPAINVQAVLKNTPLVQANCMLFYDKKIGVGASVKNASFASAIIQIRMLKNMVAGFAYDYSINRLSVVAANSFEVMLAFTPGFGGDDRNLPVRKVANCPDFDF